MNPSPHDRSLMSLNLNGYPFISGINARAAVLDVDGVLIDFDGNFAAIASEVLGRAVSKVCNDYSLRKRYALTEEEFADAWSALETHPNGWGNMPMIPGAVEAVHRLQNHGYTIHLVTGIDACHSEARLQNLRQNSVEVDSIDCVGRGQNSKAEHLHRLRPIMYVEDRLALLNESEHVPYRVFIDHGDTQDGHVVHEDLIHVRSLAQWVDHVDRLHGGPAEPRMKTRRMGA